MNDFEITVTVVAVILSYLLGSLSSAVIISKLFYGDDIRKSGSGNAGATNMLRTHGKKTAALTLFFDILKGVAAIFIASLFAALIDTPFYSRLLPFLAGIFVVLGHSFPVFFGFRGGKGVATSLGVILVLNYKVALIVMVFALLIMLITRYVSLGSVIAGILYIAVDTSYMIFTGQFFLPELIFDVILGGMLILRHTQNIKRLLNGTENKLKKKADAK